MRKEFYGKESAKPTPHMQWRSVGGGRSGRHDFLALGRRHFEDWQPKKQKSHWRFWLWKRRGPTLSRCSHESLKSGVYMEESLHRTRVQAMGRYPKSTFPKAKSDTCIEAFKNARDEFNDVSNLDSLLWNDSDVVLLPYLFISSVSVRIPALENDVIILNVADQWLMNLKMANMLLHAIISCYLRE